jgi:transglutaminase-like putative cysteine protease
MDPFAPLDEALRPYLEPGELMDSQHPDILAYAEPFARACAGPRETAVALYYAIRDRYRYDPYAVNLDRTYMKASAFLHRERGYCIEKANLLGACARALGIPARLGFGDVRNHIGTEKLERRLGTNLMVFHGYTELWLDGRWVKATPAFNRELCEMLGVEPLEFDGRSDSVFQACDPGGTTFMVYERDRGTYAEWPVEEFEAALREHYGHLFANRDAQSAKRPLEG